MKKVLTISAILVILTAAVGVSVIHHLSQELNKAKSDNQQFILISEKVKEIEAKAEEDQKLGQYAINMMYMAGAGKRLSDTKKQILARSIVRVANDIFSTDDHRKAFIAVLAIESAFNREAQSPTGPKGYGQLAKAAFKEGMEMCGSPDVTESDVWETDINLYASACYFRNLLEKYNGDPYASIVSYNQGANSAAAKSYTKTGSMDNLEALKYVAKFTFLKRNVTDKKHTNVPSIDDLPKPGKK